MSVALESPDGQRKWVQRNLGDEEARQKLLQGHGWVVETRGGVAISVIVECDEHLQQNVAVLCISRVSAENVVTLIRKRL